MEIDMKRLYIFCLFDPEGQIAGYSLSLHAA